MLKQSPLSPIFRALNAQFEDQDGWLMPTVIHSSEMEIEALTQGIGLADTSSSGKVVFEGNSSASSIQAVTGANAPALAIHAGLESEHLGIFRLRTDKFFIRAFPGKNTSLLTHSPENQTSGSRDLVTITDQTHGLAEITLVGPKSPTLLSRLCGLDFHMMHFPNLTGRESSVAKTHQLILRQDYGALTAYRLIGDRSLAIYLWATIIKAGQDLGASPVGARALDSLG